jgi:hypothetical protein
MWSCIREKGRSRKTIRLLCAGILDLLAEAQMGKLPVMLADGISHVRAMISSLAKLGDSVAL